MALLMVGTSVAGVALRPEAKASGPPPEFDKNVFKSFGNWKML